MREIKFRYWDMVRKEFITDCDVYFVAEDIIFAGDLNNLPLVDVTGNVQMSQYTGLKDKNGKEIYEGDILECHHKIKGNVFFHDGSFRLSSEQCELKLEDICSYDDLNQYLIEDNNLVVIGNIYENPGLLQS